MAKMATRSVEEPIRKAARFRMYHAWFTCAPIFIAVIVARPLAEKIRLSFTDAATGGENHVGLATFEKLINVSKFYNIIGRTSSWMFLSVRPRHSRSEEMTCGL